MNKLIAGSTGVALMVVCGCVSAERESEYAERKAEYAEWQASVDGVASVSLTEFEAKYRPGWRSRASEKRIALLAREQEESLERKRQSEYEEWLASEDKVEGTTREVFEQKYKSGWRERDAQKRAIRRAKEERQKAESRHRARIEALRKERNEFLEDRVASDLKEMREKPGLLSNGLQPRLKLTEQDKLAGDALLSEFGTKFMPNTYGSYEKIKEGAAELQQIFNEEFPNPERITNASPQWRAFNKVLEKFVKARAEYFQCHDELCHYWTSYRLGVLTAEDLATLDGQPPAVQLLPEREKGAMHASWRRYEKLTEKEAAFAAKYSPETFAINQALDRECEQLDALLKEVGRQRCLMDAARFDRAWYSACFKMKELCNELIAIRQDLQTWYADHRIAEKSSEEIARLDQARAKELKAFVDSLPTSIKDRTLGPVISARDMVKLPNGLWMMRTEVTQMQWMIVLGDNPSFNKTSADRPVEGVDTANCERFISELNEKDGTNYRLPSCGEWKYACLAGGTGQWGLLRNGQEMELKDKKIISVAMRQPNAWGLYDMHGNVGEFCGHKKDRWQRAHHHGRDIKGEYDLSVDAGDGTWLFLNEYGFRLCW